MRRVQNVKVAPSVDDEDFGSIDAILNDVNTEMRDLLSEVNINTGGEAEKSTPRMSARGRGREAGPSSARMEVVHEDSDFDEEAIFSNGPVKKSGWDGGDDRSGSSEEESDDAEEIKFAHEVEDEGHVRELEKNMDKLVLQLDEFRKKYRSASEAMREKEDLKLKVEELEEELDEMQSAFEEEMADRDKSGGLLDVMGMSGVGGGSARNKTNGHGAGIVDNSAMEAEIRSQLMHAEDNAEDDMSHMMATDAAKVSWRKRLEAVLELSLPFRKDIRQVEARFGTAVGAYLSFYRWIYMQFAVLFLSAAGFGVVHISYMVAARVPFGQIVSLDPLTFLLGFMQFQTFREEERLLYIALIITLNIVLFANGLMKLISEDQKRKRITAVSNDEELKYAKFILGAWDNNLGSKAEADDLQGSIGQNLVLLNSETRSKGAILSRSGTEVFILCLRRFIANIVYIITVVASADIIITLQVRQKELDSILPVDFITIPTIGVTAINSLTPTFLEIITEFEKWDSGDMELRFLTFRTYLSSTINLGILVMTVLMTADNTLMRGNAELNFFDFDLTNGIFLASRSYDVVRDNMGLVEQEVASTCERMEAAAGLAFGQVFSDSLTKAFFFWVTGVTPKIFSAMTGSEWVKEEVPHFNSIHRRL
jgi:hypothetical protein